MGPRSVERGNAAAKLNAQAAASGFNGATLGRAWKQGHHWHADRPDACFNGATLGRAWKPGA